MFLIIKLVLSNVRECFAKILQYTCDLPCLWCNLHFGTSDCGASTAAKIFFYVCRTTGNKHLNHSNTIIVCKNVCKIDP